MNLTKTQQEDRVRMYEELNLLSENELVALCKERSVEGSGRKEDLIRALVAASSVVQEPDLPQALAISTKDPEAKSFVQKANAYILPQSPDGRVLREKMKVRHFALPNKEGQLYQVKCPYTSVKSETLTTILDKGWLLPLDNQRALYTQLKTNPAAFDVYLIRKKSIQGKFYLMLFCQKKPLVSNV